MIEITEFVTESELRVLLVCLIASASGLMSAFPCLSSSLLKIQIPFFRFVGFWVCFVWRFLFSLQFLLSQFCYFMLLFLICLISVSLLHSLHLRPPSYSSHLLDSPLPFLPRLPVTRHSSSKPSTKSKKTVSLCSCYLLRHVSMNYFFTFVCRCCICCIALYLICFPRNLLSCSTESPRIATIFSKQCVRNKMLTRWIIYAIFVSATNLFRNKNLSWHNLNVCVSREPNFYKTCVYSASLHRKGLHATQRKVPHENLLHGLLPVEIGQKSDWTILSRIARWNLLHQDETYSMCTPFRSTNIDMHKDPAASKANNWNRLKSRSARQLFANRMPKFCKTMLSQLEWGVFWMRIQNFVSTCARVSNAFICMETVSGQKSKLSALDTQILALSFLVHQPIGPNTSQKKLHVVHIFLNEVLTLDFLCLLWNPWVSASAVTCLVLHWPKRWTWHARFAKRTQLSQLSASTAANNLLSGQKNALSKNRVTSSNLEKLRKLSKPQFFTEQKGSRPHGPCFKVQIRGISGLQCAQTRQPLPPLPTRSAWNDPSNPPVQVEKQGPQWGLLISTNQYRYVIVNK
jgi:hypothetical protein